MRPFFNYLIISFSYLLFTLTLVDFALLPLGPFTVVVFLTAWLPLGPVTTVLEWVTL